MTPVARQALIVACCCFAGFLVSTAVAIGLSLAALADHDMGGTYVAVGVYLVGLWLALSTVLLVVHNWEE